MASNQKQNLQQRFNPQGGKPVFAWEAPEFVRYKKTKTWFLIMFLIGITLGLIFGFQHQWSSVAVVVVALFVFTTLSNAKPRKLKCALYQEGVVIEDKVHGFNKFKSFWMESSDIPKAKLQLLGRLAGQVSLPIVEIDPEQVRLFLGKHLPEEENRGPDLVDTINSIMRF